MPEVWFIRHGESISNANLVTSHPALSPLTPKGEQEALLIPGAFNGRKPDLIITSPYVRAEQTAVPTLNHFAPVRHEIWPVHEFTYLAPKRYAGTTGDQRSPFAQAYWERSDPDEQEGGGGESFRACLNRVHITLARLQQHEADFVAVFTHGLFVRLLLWAGLTNTSNATSTTQRYAHHFIRAVRMPNAAICVVHLAENNLLFSSFQTEHLTI
ncbi:MAG: histidine phosphatase family protein [Anaerolineales bacterium]|nr:histidine phosphatase family protein [Anaerolineales bacterium]